VLFYVDRELEEGEMVSEGVVMSQSYDPILWDIES
jgi:hypothetical protein